MSTIQNNIEQNEDTLNVKDFIFMCLAKWYWFVISLFVVLSLATFYIKNTAYIYTFYAGDDKERLKGNIDVGCNERIFRYGNVQDFEFCR